MSDTVDVGRTIDELGESVMTKIGEYERALTDARAESKHWCDHATKLVADLIAADESLAGLRYDAARLRTALERIAQYDVDWTKGPAFNVNVLQAIAEKALAALPDFTGPVLIEPKESADAERARQLQTFLNWRLAKAQGDQLLGIAAEVNAVGNAGKDPAAAVEAIGKILGEPF